MPRISVIGEGPKIQVKLSNQTAGWLQRTAQEQHVGVSEVARQHIEDSLYLYHLPASLYARFQHEANRRRLSLSSLMQDVLTQLATTLPVAPPELVIPQQIAPQGPPPKKRAK